MWTRLTAGVLGSGSSRSSAFVFLCPFLTQPVVSVSPRQLFHILCKIWTIAKLLIMRCVSSPFLLTWNFENEAQDSFETLYYFRFTTFVIIKHPSCDSDCLSVINLFCTFLFSWHFHVLAQLLALFFPCCHWTRSQTKLTLTVHYA